MKITQDMSKNERGLIQLIGMGKSTRHICTDKNIQSCCFLGVRKNLFF